MLCRHFRTFVLFVVGTLAIVGFAHALQSSCTTYPPQACHRPPPGTTCPVAYPTITDTWRVVGPWGNTSYPVPVKISRIGEQITASFGNSGYHLATVPTFITFQNPLPFDYALTVLNMTNALVPVRDNGVDGVGRCVVVGPTMFVAPMSFSNGFTPGGLAGFSAFDITFNKF